MTAGLVRAIAGDVGADDLGVVNSHDHLFLSTPVLAGEELSDRESATREAELFRGAGGHTVVQWTPRGLARRLTDLRELSAQSRVHIIAATGRHRREVYRTDDPLLALREDDLAEVFISDILDLRCGLIKIGTGPSGATPFERISLDAAAAAHHATGVPIAIHLEGGKGAFPVVDILRSLDVPPHAIVLGHLGRNADLDYIAEAGATGAFICIDGPSPGHAATDESLLPVLERVIDAGNVDALLVGGDTTTLTATTGAGGRGMSGLLTRTRAAITHAFGEAVTRAIFVSNPARAWQQRSRAAEGAATRHPGADTDPVRDARAQTFSARWEQGARRERG